jgi:hypothetical protein
MTGSLILWSNEAYRGTSDLFNGNRGASCSKTKIPDDKSVLLNVADTKINN